MVKFEESGTVAFFNRAKQFETQGKPLIHLEVGELDFPPPSFVIRDAQEILTQRSPKYTPSWGLPELREEIGIYLEKRYRIPRPDSRSEIMVTPGAKFALFLAFSVLLDPGDECILFSPYFPTFKAIVEGIGGKVIEQSFLGLSDAEITTELQKKITNKTRVIVINSPNNPSGIIISKDLLGKIAGIISSQKNIHVISDDIYERFTYEGQVFSSITQFPEIRARTIVINGFSKSFAMTGFRIGYAIGPSQVISEVDKIQQNTVTCVNETVQLTGAKALERTNHNDADYYHYSQDMLAELARRRQFLLEQLDQIPDISIVRPYGAFYVFPKFGRIESSYEFALKLLDKGAVVTPGIVFGQFGESHLRLCYTQPIKILEQFIQILKTIYKK